MDCICDHSCERTKDNLLTFKTMKKIYIIPVLTITEISVENMVAQSGPQLSGQAADSQYGMDVKSSSHSYNVWDDDWSAGE